MSVSLQRSSDVWRSSALDSIRDHAIVAYYVLTFAISWGLILLVLGPGDFFGTAETVTVSGPLGLAGPSIACLVLTGLIAGRPGYRELGYRLTNWRFSARWYALALLTAPILNSATLIALSLASSEFQPAIITDDDKASLLLAGIAAGLLVPVFEELGWTGFAMPRLRQRHSVLTTGLIMGILWGAWHFPMFAGDAASSGAIPPALYVAALLFSWLVPYRVLMVWVAGRTGSIFAAVLMHFPIVVNAIVLGNEDLSGTSMFVSLIAFGAVLWTAVAVVALTRSREFLARPLPDVEPPLRVQSYT
jgi:membrane protease YdiL (CAAX protease family)